MSKKRSAKNTNKKNSIKINSKKNNKNSFLKYIDENFRIILLVILLIIIILLFINNINMKKAVEILSSKTEVKEVIKKDKIIFLGDSITYRYDIQKYYNNANFINKGINGNTTTDVLERLQTSVYDYNVKKVVLLIGTNDLRDEINSIDNIELIINKIKNHDEEIEIIVQSIYPVNGTDNPKIDKAVVDKRTNEKIKQINKKIKELCEEKKLTYVNVYDELTDKDGNLKLEYTTEGLHLSEEGYKKVTNVLNKYINE